MKKYLILTILMLLIVACGVPQQDHDAVIEQARVLDSDLLHCQSVLTRSQAELEWETSQLVEAESKLDNAIVSLSELQDKHDNLSADYTETEQFYHECLAEYLCSERVHIDFTSNYTVGRSLIEFVAERAEDDVSGNWWKLFWTGDKHSLHTVEAYSREDDTNYVWEFIVYFKGEFYGEHPNGVFWTGVGCWLYRDDS